MIMHRGDSAPSSTPPDAADAARQLAQAHASWLAGDRRGAVALLSALAARTPDDAVVRVRLGAYALAEHRDEDALRWLQAAIALAPDDGAAWNNLGTALLRLGRDADAVDALRRAIALAPNAVSACVNLGTALQRTGDIDGAVASLEAARTIDPDAADVRSNLGNLYKEQGRFEDAFAEYDAARRADPALRTAWSNLLALTKLSTRHAPEEILALHRAYSAWFEPQARADYVPPCNGPDPERRLRVGYLSPDCHTALPPFVEPVLAAHDRARIDVFAYFNNPQAADALARVGPVTARTMRGASDAEVAQWIRADEIDLLVDIAGHTGHNRLGVLAGRPAPVQLTWLDSLATTGLDAVDYRITDAIADPPGASEAAHSETLVRIAPTQWCWRPPARGSEPGPPPLLAAGHPTLGSFNHAAKLTDATLALWSRLLAAMPDARLVVVGVPPGRAQERVRAALGDGATRSRILPRLGSVEFRAAVASADIGLDPLPFSGATTTLEALWQGIPVVTWPGRTSASRSSASLLCALGMDDWIARDADDYVAIVRRAAAAPTALAKLRAALPARLAASPICDAGAFARALEGLLSDAWRQWCSSKAGGSPQAPPGAPAIGGAEPVSARAARARIDGDARLARIDAALRAGAGDAVVDDARALLDAFPEWRQAQRAYLQALLAWSRGQPDLAARSFPAPPPRQRRPRISAIVCSIDATKFNAATASYRRRFEGWPLEIIGVHDARSLAEGYNRGAAQSTGEILVFSHDDIELVTADFADRLAAHLDQCDGVGVAGASKVVGPKWDHAGPRFAHGHILHPAPAGRGGALLMASGFQRPVCDGIRLLDGVFIAVRRHVWETHRFDDDRYDGFHLYDADFSWRASAAGAQLAVALDLTLFHRSLGRYDAAWRRYARRFVAQAGLDPLAPPALGNLQARVDTQAQADALRAALLHFRFGGRPAG